MQHAHRESAGAYRRVEYFQIVNCPDQGFHFVFGKLVEFFDVGEQLAQTFLKTFQVFDTWKVC